MNTFTLQLPSDSQREYPIHIGKHLLEQKALFAPFIHNRPVCVVSNVTVSPLYLKTLEKGLEGAKSLSSILLLDGETYKNAESLNQIYAALLKERFERRGVLIALGGGVVGDITGFAAATYQRGVDFIQVPTTLLAMVDSSVGGKTAINHPFGKNMIGAFYQPKMVVMDTETLKTLPKREWSAGMAEVLKYGAIADVDFWQDLAKASPHLENDFLNSILFHSVKTKARIVEEDERESGKRALLNFGHTFGHAIEKILGFGTFLHGEAVAVGMLMAAEFSKNRALLTEKDVAELKTRLQQVGLPIKIPRVEVEFFIQAMRQDKKVEKERIRLVILEKIGAAQMVDDATEEELKRAIVPFME